MMEHFTHPFPPLYNAHSRVLILGSFPSVKSREQAFFYAHPQNRFWSVLAALFSVQNPTTIEQKTELILSHRLALWDTIQSCDIVGSSDSSIQNAKANDLAPILQTADIQAIFCNGATSYALYQKYIEPQLHLPACKLPSTSPANAVWSKQKLIEAWKSILHYL